MPPYDDPSLNEFAGYFEAKEPGRKERAESWAAAIGLQRVDGLLTSVNLREVACRHIEGEISASEARDIVDRYYESKEGRDLPEDVREADKVSARIIEVINDESFHFAPCTLQGLHGMIFEDVLQFAGAYREVNIRKHEWILNEDSVTYGPWRSIEANLESAFAREEEYDYAGKSPSEMVAHLARFIARIWQIHPFREGNTRTTAVFAIKYLRSLNIPVTNELFAANSWFFRNALVRANYENPLKNIPRDYEPIERFFRCLILGEKHELKSRYLRVSLSQVERRELADGRQTTDEGCQKRLSGKGCQKTEDKLVELLKNHPHLTQVGMASALFISRQAVQKHLAKLKASGRLRRIGPDKGGHWEVEMIQ